MKLSILILVITALTVNLFSQNDKVTLISGSLKDINNMPVTAKIYFIDETGVKNFVNSNSKDGTYSAILKNGKEYRIIIEKYEIINSSSYLSTLQAKTYHEVNADFKLSPFEVGTTILKMDMFTKNDSISNANFNKKIEDLAILMKFQNIRKIDVIINSSDCNFKDIEEKRKIKVGKKTKNEIVTLISKEQLRQNILDARKRVIEQIFSSNGIKDACFSVSYNYSNDNSGSENQISSDINDLIITISKILTFN